MLEVVLRMTEITRGSVVAITGASSGIGEATARLLAARGASLILGARRIQRLNTIADELRGAGADVATVAIDVSTRDGLDRLVAAATPVFRSQKRGHFVTTVSTTGLKIVPGMGVYAATKNAVRTIMETLRQESTDGVIRTTSISPGFVRTELSDSIDDPAVRARIRSNMDAFGLAPEAVARAIAFAIEQPHDVEIGEITIRPTVQD